jgi:hypothetical protein
MALVSFSDVFALFQGDFGSEKEVEEVKKHQKVRSACTQAARPLLIAGCYCCLEHVIQVFGSEEIGALRLVLSV